MHDTDFKISHNFLQYNNTDASPFNLKTLLYSDFILVMNESFEK